MTTDRQKYNAEMKNKTYRVVFNPTAKVVRKGIKTLSGALRVVDRLDNAYGAYRYRHEVENN